VRLVRARHHQETGRVAVEPVDVPERSGSSAIGLAGGAVRERAVAWPADGWTNAPAGLSTAMLVLVGGRGPRRASGLAALRHLELEISSGSMALRLAPSTGTAPTAALGLRREPLPSHAAGSGRPLASRLGGTTASCHPSSEPCGSAGWRSDETSTARRMVTPTTMTASARLKAGRRRSRSRSPRAKAVDQVGDLRRRSQAPDTGWQARAK
jgi:hypothetical protein